MNWRKIVLTTWTGTSSWAALGQQTTGAERVLGFEVKPTGISFKVPTGGCTHKENFGLETLSLKPLTLRLVRLRPDYCAGVVPGGTTITFTYAEIGAARPLPPSRAQAIVVVNDRMPP